MLALLAYFFHPDVGHLSLTINGAPVADPLARVAVLPAILVILLLTGILVALVIFGIGGLLLISLALTRITSYNVCYTKLLRHVVCRRQPAEINASLG